MQLGHAALGDIVFIVTSAGGPRGFKVRNMQDLKVGVSARWENSDIHLQKPRSQFSGPALDTATFTIMLDVKLGMKPRAEIEKLQKYCLEGKVMPFQIGGKKLGRNKWKITQIEQDWQHIDNKGLLHKAGLSITLEEYI